MALDFRRGASAIADAQSARKSSGKIRPFAPQVFWPSADDAKYILFLNSMDSIPTVKLISFIPTKVKGRDEPVYEQVIARTDPAIGESTDQMVDDWDGIPRDTCISVAVEIEPVMKESKGRQRPSGFRVATTTYERRIRDEEGELTDEIEEVESPRVGFVTQSPHNFYNILSSYDANEAPIEETPVKVTRIGERTATTYSVDGYPEQDIDLSSLIDLIDGVSYLGDDLEDLLKDIDGAEDIEAAHIIGEYLLDKRLAELADEDRYNEILSGITESLDKWGNKKSSKPKKERTPRRSQRAASEPVEESVEEAPKTRTRRSVKDAASEPGSDAKDKIARLREQAARRSSPSAE